MIILPSVWLIFRFSHYFKKCSLQQLLLLFTSDPGIAFNWHVSQSVCVSHSVVSDSLQPHGLQPTRLLCLEFSRQEYWRGQSFPFPADLPDPEIQPRTPALQADSLPSEPPGKPPSIQDSSLDISCCCYHDHNLLERFRPVIYRTSHCLDFSRFVPSGLDSS